MTEAERNTLTPEEMKVVRMMAHRLAACEREDIIGAIMKCGGFHHLKADDGVVNLAHKLEPTDTELYPHRYTEGWEDRWKRVKYAEYIRIETNRPLTYEGWCVEIFPTLGFKPGMPL